jgi:ribA/ribD-fused uncharacterized protein
MIDSFKGEYEFLSNFYPATVSYEGEVYPPVEHAFQAAKTLNPQMRLKIRLSNASGAKKLGRQLDLRADWETIKVDVMRELLKAKFSDPELREKLKATGEEPLVEGNWWGDTFWGVCRGQGDNHLGVLLMEIRDSL